jgi:hypothetical protein
VGNFILAILGILNLAVTANRLTDSRAVDGANLKDQHD